MCSESPSVVSFPPPPKKLPSSSLPVDSCYLLSRGGVLLVGTVCIPPTHRCSPVCSPLLWGHMLELERHLLRGNRTVGCDGCQWMWFSLCSTHSSLKNVESTCSHEVSFLCSLFFGCICAQYLRRCRVASSASLSGVLDIHEKDSDHTQDTVGAEGIEEEEEESRQLADDLDLEEKEFIRNSLEGVVVFQPPLFFIASWRLWMDSMDLCWWNCGRQRSVHHNPPHLYPGSRLSHCLQSCGLVS